MTDDVTTDAELLAKVSGFLAEHDPVTTEHKEFLGARFDAGLAWVNYPLGCGGLGLPRHMQALVDAAFAAAGAERTDTAPLTIGLGMAAPTILQFGTDAQRARYLRPIWTGEEVWCQLFSEPGAGSDLAALGTRAVRDGDEWVVNGHKVWTSLAHEARFAILVTRTDPDLPKHKGMTYFLCDMTAPGVEVRPLRQITGEAEFNEVYLTDVRLPDESRVGDVGEGWRVATGTLMNERVAIGGGSLPREGGAIALVTHAWRQRPEIRTHGMHDAVLRAWVDAEAARLSTERLRQALAAGRPGPEGSGVKLAFSTLNQSITGLALELLGEESLRYDNYTMRRPKAADFVGRVPAFSYLRSKGNSIEGGTSEILRNIVAERILGLPGEIRVDKDVAWKDLAR